MLGFDCRRVFFDRLVLHFFDDGLVFNLAHFLTHKLEEFFALLSNLLIEAQFLAGNAVFGKKFVFGLVFFLVVALLNSLNDADNQNCNETNRCEYRNDKDDQCGGAVNWAEFEI